MTINLTEVKEMLGKITQGKWEVDRGHKGYGLYIRTSRGNNKGRLCSMWDERSNKEINANFIASAPDYIRYLLAEVERLEIDNLGHAYALDVLRTNCGLPSGESYQEVDAYIAKLKEELVLLREVERAAGKISGEDGPSITEYEPEWKELQQSLQAVREWRGKNDRI